LGVNWGELLCDDAETHIGELFRKFDVDRNGKISIDELRKGLMDNGCPVFTFFQSEEELFTNFETTDMIVSAFGKDKGEIGDLEIEILNIAGPYPRLKEIFKEMDQDGDKGLSIEELTQGLRKITMLSEAGNDEERVQRALKASPEISQQAKSTTTNSSDSVAALEDSVKKLEYMYSEKMNKMESLMNKILEGQLTGNSANALLQDKLSTMEQQLIDKENKIAELEQQQHQQQQVS
jgi:Ca2+-binding EF-hand superfamily protein